MSGHSKWAKIKRAKGANDAKKGQTFTQLANQIAIAAREGGGDPDMNFILRMQMDKARAVNMPTASIERAIDRGTGKSKDGSVIERVTYEGVGPAGSAILIDCLTDNTNRSVADVRNIFEKNGLSLGSANSVSWQFKEVGLIILRSAFVKKAEKYGQDFDIKDVDPEELELELMDIDGVNDIEIVDIDDESGQFKGFEIICNRENLDKVRTAIQDKELKLISAELIKVADQKVYLGEEERAKLEKLIEELEDYDDVDSVWTNANLA